MAFMPSKYAGKCKKCRTAYSLGDQIWWSRATGAICLVCKGAESDDKASQSDADVVKAYKGALAKGVGLEGKALRRFESWSEYVDYAATMKDAGRKGRFYGDTDFRGALELARRGWSAPRADIDVLTHKIADHLESVLEKSFVDVWDVSGSVVDIGRFLGGEPECMIDTTLMEIAKPGRVVTILINGCFSAGIKGSQTKARGSAVVGLVDALEKCSYSTEIWLEISHKKVSYLVKVKDASQELDIDVLMFAIGHEGCFRQLNFAIQDAEPASLGVGKDSGMGYVWPLSCKELVDANICLEPIVYGDESSADAEKWIKNELGKYGLIKESEQL